MVVDDEGNQRRARGAGALGGAREDWGRRPVDWGKTWEDVSDRRGEQTHQGNDERNEGGPEGAGRASAQGGRKPRG